MNKWTILLLVTAISNCRGQNITTWCPNLGSDMLKCSTQLNDDLSNNSSSFVNILSISNGLTVICQESNSNSVKEFYDCYYGKFFSCIPSDWHKAFPDVNQAKSGFDLLCQNEHEIDFNCWSSTSREWDLASCLVHSSSGKTDLSTVEGYLAYTCGQYAFYSTCIDQAFGSCTKRTAKVMEEIVEIQKPKGCINNAGTLKPSLILLVLVMFSVHAGE